ncbi:hypothetical protein [uncultured Desulfovibrio sp.]|uniref:hypothetical protein n=1 Tax=uncultured Desulfovibrio sp. TaxID=167968 RepID=UPI002636D6E1|nr:hypothetical protein [uncultured Desulfovibrio sp.]
MAIPLFFVPFRPQMQNVKDRPALSRNLIIHATQLTAQAALGHARVAVGRAAVRAAGCGVLALFHHSPKGIKKAALGGLSVAF